MERASRELLKRLLSSAAIYSRYAAGVELRPYQAQIAEAIIDSVMGGKGLSFVVMMSRQGGKNETQAQIESYLLMRLSQTNCEIVKASPTFKPQTENAMRRLERTLESNALARGMWQRESGYIYRIGKARVYFLSAQKEANVVGATASTLLECDEAQDVLISKWDKDFAPMAASTNATTVFWGTAWTDKTLLARELRAARAAEAMDGARRVFMFDADAVSVCVPAYAAYVAKQIAKMGRQHPLIRTQYFLEEIGSEGGMFPASRRELMRGDHDRRYAPMPDRSHAMMIDVAGEDEGALEGELENPRRDATAVTIVEIDPSTLGDDLIRAPRYLVRERARWVGAKHTTLYGKIVALIQIWNPRFVVVDATGVGAGLASFLSARFPGRVIAFEFSQKTKSDLGWGFLAVCDTGRFKDWKPPLKRDESYEFWREVDGCDFTIKEGAGKVMSWGVPAGARNNETGEYLHDDLLISAALCAELDKQSWSVGGSVILQGRDPLEDEKGF